MMVNFGTNLTRTQQGGFATVIILLVAGLIGLGFVRGGGKTLEV
jgi:UMF1 family MFS transporter